MYGREIQSKEIFANSCSPGRYSPEGQREKEREK